MLRAIDEYQITGITTTLGFGKFVMQHEAFTSGNFDTHFVQKCFTPGLLQSYDAGEALIAGILIEKLLNEKRVNVGDVVDGETRNWIKNRKRYS